MTYSSALYPAGTAAECEDLATAQRRKWDHLLDLLQPSAKDHLLEIGCGWGGFAMHAAREAGLPRHGRHALRGAARVGDSARSPRRDSMTASTSGCRTTAHVTDEFSAIASIEMFEAVGEKWWPVFFRRMRELVAPGGAVALQTITIEDHRFEEYRRKPDFVQRYIFPGGMLPSPERFCRSSKRRRPESRESRCSSAAATPRRSRAWQSRFEAAVPAVRDLGFDERFVRMWRYYLAYCRAGFSEGTIDVMQVRLDV